MRKKFTQLFMGLALIVGFTTMSIAQCDSIIPPPPGAYYNFQFDGGLEGWRALDAAGFETTTGWQWDETGYLKRGFYGGSGPTNIVSASQCNGAVVMDSDFLDNDSTAVSGVGDCPAVCNGYFVSPIMDLSSSNAIELVFTQAVRQFQSDFFIYVSIDGGATNVDTIVVNDDVVINLPTTINTLRLPICSAGGQSDVVISFHYAADYYYWALDDVSLVEAEEVVDMRVNRNFYSKVTNYATPSGMTSTVPILADIENLKAFSNPGSTLHFRARNAVGGELYSTSRAYGEVAGCSTDENKLFDGMFDMPNEVGNYTVEFEMDAEGDVNPANDLITAPFKITDNEFRKLPTQEEYGDEYLSGVRYGSGLLSWGAYFHVPANDKGQSIDSISLGIITNTGVVPSTGIINVGVYQWIDFADIGTVNEGERVLLGEAEILVLPNSPEFIQWTFPILGTDDEPIIPEAGAELLVIASTNPFNGVTNYFFNAVPTVGFEEYSCGATQLAHREANLIGGYSSFAAGDAASHDDRHDRELFNIDGSYVFDISMKLSGTVGTEDIKTDLGVTIFPSPASTKVNVDLSLDELSEKVSIEIMDMTGNKTGVYNFSNIKKERLTIDVSDLPSGMYLMNVRTEAGMTSQKISVIH